MTTLGATFITLLPFLIHLYEAVWRAAKLQNKVRAIALEMSAVKLNTVANLHY